MVGGIQETSDVFERAAEGAEFGRNGCGPEENLSILIEDVSIHQ